MPTQPLALVAVDLTCGHQRRVDRGIASLVRVALINQLWCITCATDVPTVTSTTTTDGDAVHEGDTHA